MLTVRKTAFAAAIATLALGAAGEPAAARDGRAVGLSVGQMGASAIAVTKVGDRRYSRGYRRWAPPRRVWRPHRHYRRPPPAHRWHPAPRRHYWKRHRHGDDALFGALVGFALGAVVTNSLSHHHDYPAPAVIVAPPPRPLLMGTVIGGTMGASDHGHAGLVLEKTRTGHAVEWTNPDTGNRYTMTPTRTYRNAAGEDCRDYSVWGWIDGFEERLVGTACRTNDGAWRSVS